MWVCPQEGQAWPLLAYGGRDIVLPGLPECCLGGGDLILQVSFDCPSGSPFPTPTPQARRAILAFQHELQTSSRNCLGCLPAASSALRDSGRAHSAPGAPWGQDSDLLPNLGPGSLPTSQSIKLGSFHAAEPTGTFHRGIPRGGGLRPGVIWKKAKPGQGWAGHSWFLWGGCVLPRVSPRAGVWNRVSGSWQAFQARVA